MDGYRLLIFNVSPLVSTGQLLAILRACGSVSREGLLRVPGPAENHPGMASIRVREPETALRILRVINGCVLRELDLRVQPDPLTASKLRALAPAQDGRDWNIRLHENDAEDDVTALQHIAVLLNPAFEAPTPAPAARPALPASTPESIMETIRKEHPSIVDTGRDLEVVEDILRFREHVAAEEQRTGEAEQLVKKQVAELEILLDKFGS